MNVAHFGGTSKPYPQVQDQPSDPVFIYLFIFWVVSPKVPRWYSL